MTIPKFDQTFLPILEVLSNGETLKTSDLPDKILEKGYFHLSNEELTQKTTTGANIYFDRVSWGVTYLRQGKFVERPSRGFVKITKKGIDLLTSKPKELSLEWLKKDNDYIAYEPIRTKEKPLQENSFEDMSPHDLVDQGVEKINEQPYEKLIYNLLKQHLKTK